MFKRTYCISWSLNISPVSLVTVVSGSLFQLDIVMQKNKNLELRIFAWKFSKCFRVCDSGFGMVSV